MIIVRSILTNTFSSYWYATAQTIRPTKNHNNRLLRIVTKLTSADRVGNRIKLLRRVRRDYVSTTHVWATVEFLVYLLKHVGRNQVDGVRNSICLFI